MNDNRKLSLGLVSMLAILMTSMTFLYRQASPYWISSQLLLLTGCVIFLGMALFLYDARHLKLFAIPGAMIAAGELMAVCSRFRFLFDQSHGLRMESITAGGQPIEVLAAVACAFQFVVLAWTVIDISMDFSFCDTTCLALAICLGFAAAVDLIVFSFCVKGGMELVRVKSVETLSDLLTFGTVVVFYFGYTKERRMIQRYYRAQNAECRRAKRQQKIAEEEQARLEEQEQRAVEQQLNQADTERQNEASCE